MPTVSFALSRLNQELRTSKYTGEKCVKIIHGYGSTGRGGSIKAEVRAQLTQKKRSGQIAEFVSGENFSPFSESARRICDFCRDASKDKDYCRGNEGITIVLLHAGNMK
jgi:hypothetical protein